MSILIVCNKYPNENDLCYFNPKRYGAGYRVPPFRAKFRLNVKDQLYFETKGLPLILSHARDFIEQRLAAPFPKNDGKQTPMRGHPVFVAQHATATCCRGCLAKWHNIPQGQALDEQHKLYIVDVIALWLEHRASVKADDSANPFDPDRGL